MAAGVRRIARINIAAFVANIQKFAATASDFTLDARANAYGHGLVSLAQAAIDAGAAALWISPSEESALGELKAFRALKYFSTVTQPNANAVISAAAYGLDGFGTPVMTLVGEVISVKHVAKGAGVSYGYSYHTPADTTLALVALGYADGVPRLASNRARVSVAGGIHPLVGRVAMDQFVVDCGEAIPSIGDDAVLFGDPARDHPSATDWAEQTRRRARELTAGLGSRIVRVTS